MEHNTLFALEPKTQKYGININIFRLLQRVFNFSHVTYISATSLDFTSVSRSLVSYVVTGINNVLYAGRNGSL